MLAYVAIDLKIAIVIFNSSGLHQQDNLLLTLSTRMLYWTDGPDNAEYVAVQLDKMISNM